MTRRDAIMKTAILGATAVAALNNMQAQPPPPPTAPAPGPFTLPKLPYAFDGLEPHIDARTMEIHHDKHHATYVANLNKAVAEAPDLGKKKIDELIHQLNSVPEKIRTAVRNNGGGHLNHSLFWQMMSAKGGGQPKGPLAKGIEQTFGSFDKFKEGFSEAATKQFGSGWAWLTLDGKTLKIESTPNQDSPLTEGRIPLLGIDVWEHAYYLKYQNKRADYIAAFFNVINWDFVTERYEKFSS